MHAILKKKVALLIRPCDNEEFLFVHSVLFYKFAVKLLNLKKDKRNLIYIL